MTIWGATLCQYTEELGIKEKSGVLASMQTREAFLSTPDKKLEEQKISLDAHHFNPITTFQIHQANGIYVTQVKENQAIFLKQCSET